MTDRATIQHVAREIATEAQCVGLSKISYAMSAKERQEAWEIVAVAAIAALRDKVGPTIIDRIIAPETETAT
jgi:hypothetical protein